MAAELIVIPATFEHIAPIAIHMRQADRDEVHALAGLSPFEALELSFTRAAQSWTVLFDGVPAGMFGVGDLNILTSRGAPWFLGTDAIEANRGTFARASVHWRDQLLLRYDTLTNLVDDRNAVSIRWLKWLGFKISEPFPAGPEKLPFRVFEMRR